MINPKTLADLEDALASEIGWRKKEIFVFRAASRRASSSQSYYCRAGSVMLSAHWEGFLRASIQSYVDFVFSQELGVGQLTEPFIATFFYKEVMNAATANFPGSKEQHIKLAKKIARYIDEPCRRASWVVNTEGNPSSLVTRSILTSVGLDPQMGMDEASWSVYKVFLDGQLLKDRHKVAHGERFPISPEIFRERSDRVIGLCELLLRRILEAAESGMYRRYS